MHKQGWALYNRLLNSHPILSRSVTSCLGLMAGDLLAQAAARKPYSRERTLRFAAFGFVLHGPGLYAFYTNLDKFVFPNDRFSTKTVITKVVIDQCVWAPSFTCVFYAFMKAMERKSHETGKTIREKFWPTLTAGYSFWVPAHLVNYRLIPPAQRVLYVNAVNIIWNAILSTIAEKKEHKV
ncbi:hypothetical protein BSKO_08272 [Bryopsis sp. KO-2023]|nr:hypothetical protein BSKO_08272 [Bryopsis sp. KO-2023]